MSNDILSSIEYVMHSKSAQSWRGEKVKKIFLDMLQECDCQFW